MTLGLGGEMGGKKFLSSWLAKPSLVKLVISLMYLIPDQRLGPDLLSPTMTSQKGAKKVKGSKSLFKNVRQLGAHFQKLCTHRFGKFNLQKVVIHKDVWSSLSVFLLQGSRKIEENIQYLLEQALQNPVVMWATTIQFLVAHIFFSGRH